MRLCDLCDRPTDKLAHSPSGIITCGLIDCAAVSRERSDDELRARAEAAKKTLDLLWSVSQEVRDIIVANYGTTHGLPPPEPTIPASVGREALEALEAADDWFSSLNVDRVLNTLDARDHFRRTQAVVISALASLRQALGDE